jgi:hypothetical protein
MLASANSHRVKKTGETASIRHAGYYRPASHPACRIERDLVYAGGGL